MQNLRIGRLAGIVVMLAAAMALTACFGGKGDQPPSTGNLTAQVAWPGEGTTPTATVGTGAALAALSPGSIAPLDTPTGIFTIRATVSGPGMSAITRDFDTSASQGQPGSGTIPDIPAGSSRTLLLEALDDLSTVVFRGEWIGITIIAGITTQVGPVVMSLLSQVPPAPPTITSPGTSVHYSPSLAAISGVCTASPAHTVNLSGQETQSTTCLGDGTYSFTLADPGADGTYGYIVTQKHPTSGLISPSATLVWFRDNLAPAPPAVVSPAGGAITTGGASLVIAGECEDGAAVSLDGGAQQTLCVEGAYAFTVTQPASYTITQTDRAGNPSGGAAVTWTFDAARPPAPVITSPSPNPHHSNTAIGEIGGTCTDGLTVDLSGADTGSVICGADTPGTFTLTVADPGLEGAYLYDITQTSGPDTSGAATLRWSYDNTPPPEPVLTAPGASPVTTVTSGSSLVISGTCEAGATVTLAGDDSQSADCPTGQFTFIVKESADSTYDYTVSQTDRAGNPSVTSASVAWIRDNGVPGTPLVTIPAANPFYSQGDLTSLTVACTSLPAHTVTLTLPDGITTVTQPCAGGSATFGSLGAQGADSSQDYQVRQTRDDTGMVSGSSTFTFVRDNTVLAPVFTTPASSPVNAGGSSFPVEGTCEDGATVTLTTVALLGGSTDKATPCAGGIFSTTINKFQDDQYTITAAQTDLAGNVSAASAEVVWNRITPPVPANLSPASPHYANAPFALSGQCTDGYDVQLSGGNGASTSNPVACALSAFAFTLATPAAEGPWAYSVTQTDPVSGVTSEPASFTWHYDLTAPLAPTIGSPLITPITTGGSSLTLSGSCEIGAEVTLEDVAAASNTLQTCTSGSFSYIVGKVVDGTYDFNLTQVDRAGNGPSPAEGQRWIRNTLTAPVLDDPASEKANTPITITGACSEPNNVQVSGAEPTTLVACGAPSPANRFTFTVTDQVGDGSYTYILKQENGGFTSAGVTKVWLRDTVSDVPGITFPPASPSPYVAGDPAITITGTCEALGAVRVSTDGGTTNLDSTTCSAAGAFGFTVSQNVGETFTYSIFQTDALGNPESGAATRTWERPAGTPATPTVTTPPTSPFTSNTPLAAIVGKCAGSTATVALTDVTRGVDTDTNLACVDDGEGAGDYSAPLSALATDGSADGAYEYEISQTVSGNTSAKATLTWVFDTTIAPWSVTSPADNPFDDTSGSSQLIVSGACNEGATVTLTGDSDQSQVCPIGQTFSFTVTELVYDSFTYTLQQSDPAGNTSSQLTRVWNRIAQVPATPTLLTLEVAGTGTVAFSTPYPSSALVTALSGGNCTDGNTVKLSGQQSGSAACSTGQFSLAVNDPGVDGSFDYFVHQETPAGTPSAKAAFTWSYDTLPPGPVVLSQPTVSPIVTTGENQLFVSGSCESGATVTIGGSPVDDAGSTDRQVACSAGAFSTTLQRTPEGTYTYDIFQTDPAGNVSEPIVQKWLRDDTYPVTPVIVDASDIPLTKPIVLYTNSTADKTAYVRCTAAATPTHQLVINGDYAATVGCDVSPKAVTLTGLLAGSNEFTISQLETASNQESNGALLVWIVDTTVAAPVITTPAVSPYTAPPPLVISGTCEDGGFVDLTGATTLSTSCSGGSFAFSVPDPGVDGAYDYTVSQIDLAGNDSFPGSVATLQWIRSADSLPPPVVTYPTASPFTSNTPTLTVQGTCIDTYTVRLMVNGSQSDSIPCTFGNFSVTTPPLADGSYNLDLDQGDGVTFSAVVRQVWIKDTSLPTLVIDYRPLELVLDSALNPTREVIFEFHAEDDGLGVVDTTATFECKLGSAAFAACVSPKVYAGLTEGQQVTIQIRARDSGGNFSAVQSFDVVQQTNNTVVLYHLDGSLPADYGADDSLYALDGLDSPLTDSGTGQASGAFGDGREFLEDGVAGTRDALSAADNDAHRAFRSVFTVEAFVKFPLDAFNRSPSIKKNDRLVLVSKADPVNGELEWEFGLLGAANGNLHLYFNGSVDRLGPETNLNRMKSKTTGYAPVVLEYAPGVQDIEFHHFALVFNRGVVTFFKDGVRLNGATLRNAVPGVSLLDDLSISRGGLLAGLTFDTELLLGDTASTSALLDLEAVMDEVRISQGIRYENSTYTVPALPFSSGE